MTAETDFRRGVASALERLGRHMDREKRWRVTGGDLYERYGSESLTEPIIVEPAEWFRIVLWLNDQLDGPAYDYFTHRMELGEWPLLFGREVQCEKARPV